MALARARNQKGKRRDPFVDRVPRVERQITTPTKYVTLGSSFVGLCDGTGGFALPAISWGISGNALYLPWASANVVAGTSIFDFFTAPGSSTTQSHFVPVGLPEYGDLYGRFKVLRSRLRLRGSLISTIGLDTSNTDDCYLLIQPRQDDQVVSPLTDINDAAAQPFTRAVLVRALTPFDLKHDLECHVVLGFTKAQYMDEQSFSGTTGSSTLGWSNPTNANTWSWNCQLFSMNGLDLRASVMLDAHVEYDVQFTEPTNNYSAFI